MSRIHAADENIAALRARLSVIPAVSVIVGSLVNLAPIVVTSPVVPPIAFLIFLAWRFLRPQIWPIWAGLPLGLFDSLLSGNALGSGMLLWTATLLVYDLADNRSIWRDYWFDWMVASVSVSLYIVLSMSLSAIAGGGWMFVPLLPQIVLSILAFPLALRLCSILDRWRMSL